MTQQSVNRCLGDVAMDDIDHALGRPLNPMDETYRNYYVTDGPAADEMAASPFWSERPRGDGNRCFVVTDAGRAALKSHLRDIGDPHRAYEITFDGYPRTVIATSRSKARYSHFLDLREVLPDLTFKDYSARASVRVAR